MMTSDSLQASAADEQLLLEIRETSGAVRQKSIPCSAAACPHCEFHPEAGSAFALHGCRSRRFLIVAGEYVRTVRAWLARWRCPECQRTFTSYPPFAYPYRSYTVPQMTRRALAYVTLDSTSYRKGAQAESRPIFYSGKKGGPGDDETLSEMTLAHSSLFRWVTAFGRDPEKDERRAEGSISVAQRKFHSQRRKAVLTACYYRLSSASPGSQ